VESMLLERFPERVNLLRESSHSAHNRFDDGSLDFVFIDGDHTFEAVRGDIQLWLPKLRAGGLLIGDDWSWDSVQRAWQSEAQQLGQAPFLFVNPTNGYTLVGLVKEAKDTGQ